MAYAVGKLLHSKYNLPMVKIGGGSLMVWKCFYWFWTKDNIKNIMEPYADKIMPLMFTIQNDNDMNQSW